VCLDGKFSKVLGIKESLEGVNPLCAGVTSGNAKQSRTPLRISKQVSNY